MVKEYSRGPIFVIEAEDGYFELIFYTGVEKRAIGSIDKAGKIYTRCALDKEHLMITEKLAKKVRKYYAQQKLIA